MAESPVVAAMVAAMRVLSRGHIMIELGDYSSAERAYHEGFVSSGKLSEQTVEPRDVAANDLRAELVGSLVLAHYNTACIFSVQSSGRVNPAAPAAATTPDDAAKLRELAFDHLERALALGWNSPELLETDSDLAPLHEDPRWVKLCKQMNAKQPVAPR
jgi:hypothetical protein